MTQTIMCYVMWQNDVFQTHNNHRFGDDVFFNFVEMFHCAWNLQEEERRILIKFSSGSILIKLWVVLDSNLSSCIFSHVGETERKGHTVFMFY